MTLPLFATKSVAPGNAFASIACVIIESTRKSIAVL